MAEPTTEWTLAEEFETPDGVVRWGRMGAGEPVVLLHGTPFSSYVWRDIARGLAPRREVYVWDMLGYGRSEMRDGQDVSIPAQQAIFAALLEHWGLDAPAVVAHDFGAAVALRTALVSGRRFARLALFDAVSIPPWGTAFFRLVQQAHDAFVRLPDHLHEALVRSHIATASHAGLTPTVADRLVEPWLGRAGQEAFYRQIAQAREAHTVDVLPRYGDLDVPVLVAWGRNDTWEPPEHAEQLARLFPNATQRWIEGAGHLVQEDAPAQVVATILDFLDR